MYKIIAFILAALMLTACGDKNVPPEETIPPYTGVLPEPTAEIKQPSLSIEGLPVPSNNGTDFVASMKLGWNLGNSFDASSDNITIGDHLEYETKWNSTVTTQQMIDTVRAAGFNTVRLPVSWHNHMLDDNFTISTAWLARVKEVLDYAYSRDMYVILNMHHDISEEYCYPSNEHYEVSEKFVTSIWKQLSDYFKDYDEHLVFETMNEPRLKGTDYEWSYNESAPEAVEAAECINKLNQAAVDTIRASGGNNQSRYIMVPSYGASVDSACSDKFVLPTDLSENSNRIIVSIHAYTPYKFALDADKKNSRFAANSEVSTSQIDSFIDKLYEKFTKTGIPLIIGEFGARNKNDNTQARTDFAAYYVAAARARGFTCCWWDNNATSGEAFGLLVRVNCSWRYPDIVVALANNS